MAQRIQIYTGAPLHRRQRALGVYRRRRRAPLWGRWWFWAALGGLGLLGLVFAWRRRQQPQLPAAGGEDMGTGYTDAKSFAKMMDAVLLSLNVPQIARLAIIAQAGVETHMGTTGKAVRVNNFWNISAGSKEHGRSRDWPAPMPVLEGPDMEYGRLITQYWRVYATPLDAARDYLKFITAIDHKVLQNPDKSTYVAPYSYKDAWDRLVGGDTEGFVRTLRAAGYYTAPVENWTDSAGKRHYGYLTMFNDQSRIAQTYLAAP